MNRLSRQLNLVVTRSLYSRVFVGTWNVAGRSPVGSLAVDVDEWLNLKEAAAIYVLGYVRFRFIISVNKCVIQQKNYPLLQISRDCTFKSEKRNWS